VVQDPSDGPFVDLPRVPELTRVALLGLAAFSSEVAHLPTVEAWKVAGGKLLWWPDGSLLRQWSRGTVELLLLLLELPRLELWVMAPILLLLWST
jgi:hypothetical protein